VSEKKTAEIKLRIEPSRKVRYQQAAADEEIGLSEWLVKAADERIAAKKASQEYVAEGPLAGPQVEFRSDQFPHNLIKGGYGFGNSTPPSNPSVATDEGTHKRSR